MKTAIITIGLAVLALIFAAGILAMVIMVRSFVATWRAGRMN